MAGNFSEPRAYGNLGRAIASFHNKVSYALPNRFDVLIIPPPKMAGAPSNAERISLRCETISLPGRSLNTEEDANIYGPTREIVKGATYAGDISLTFQASAGLEERVFFEEWQKLAFDEASWNVGYYKNYVSTIEIYLLDRQDKRRYGLKLIEAYPKEIGPTDLSLGASTEIIKNTISFAYRYWTTLDNDRETSLPTPVPMVLNAVQRELVANTPSVITRLS